MSYFILTILYYSLYLTSGREDSDQLKINPPEANVRKAIHDNFYVICSSATSVKRTDIRWLSPTGEVITDADRRIYAESQNGLVRLYIFNISKIDAGMYTCSSTNHGVPLKRTITLTTYQPITFLNAPLEQEIVANTTDKVFCSVISDPPPKIEWQLVAGKPYLNDRMVVQMDGLQIHNVQLTDEGNYTCRASIDSLATFEDRNIQVTVTTRPIWIQKPTDSSATSGQNVTISCKAGGKPKPKLSFYKISPKREKISSTGRFQIASEQGYLMITNVEKGDEGLYTCEAQNSAGTISSNFDFHVQTPPVIKGLEDKTVLEGKMARILCVSEADPIPDISWQRVKADGKVVTLGDDKNNLAIYVEKIRRPPNVLTSILHLKNVTRKDGGDYKCMARNSAGEVSKNLRITVQYAPAFGTDNSKLIYYAWPGHSVNLTCKADANPSPVYRWTFHDRDLSSHPTKIFYDSTQGTSRFQVDHDPQIYGEGLWKCEATNIYGTAKQYFKIQEATIPPAPSDVSFTNVTPTTVTISLRDHIPLDRANPTFDINEIYVSYRRFDQSITDAKANDQHRILAFGGPGVIDELQPNTDYVFSLALKNPVGLSVYSKEFHIKTSKESVPYAPQITSLAISNSPSLHHLVWREPLDGGKPIKSYEILYSRGIMVTNLTSTFRPFPSEESHKEVILAPATSYLIKDLIPGSTYSVEISAINDIGKSIPGIGYFSTKKDGTFAPVLPKAIPQSKLSRSAWIGLVILLCLLILLLVDLYCFYRNRCGLTMTVCVRFCGRAPEPRKNKKHLELRSVVDDNNGTGPASNGKVLRSVDSDMLDEHSAGGHRNGHHLLPLKEEEDKIALKYEGSSTHGLVSEQAPMISQNKSEEYQVNHPTKLTKETLA